MLEVKLDSNINLFMDEVAVCGNIDIAIVYETVDVQPEELIEAESIDMHIKAVVMNKVKMPQRKWSTKTPHFKRTETYDDIKSTKGNILETDPNLQIYK